MKSLMTKGNVVEIGGNMPLLLNRSDCFWIVEQGCAEIFSVRMLQDEPIGNRRHLMSVEAGGIFSGINHRSNGLNIGFVAVGMPDTAVRCLPFSALKELNDEEGMQFSIKLDEFVNGVLHRIGDILKPKEIIQIEDKEIRLEEESSCESRDRNTWVYVSEGKLKLFTYDAAVFSKGNYVPLSRDLWASTSEGALIVPCSTLELLKADKLKEALQTLLISLLRIDSELITVESRAEFERLKLRQANDARFVRNALKRIQNLMVLTGSGIQESSLDPLLAVIEHIGAFMKMNIEAPTNIPSGEPMTLRMIANSSRIRTRTVILKGDWWKQDNGPLLAYMEDGNQPVALIPKHPRKYRLINPATGDQVVVNDDIANLLNPVAYSIYKPLPNKKLNMFDLMVYAGRSIWKRDLATVVIMGLIGGLIGMVIPQATGMLFDTIIPSADTLSLMQMGMALVMIALAGFVFQLTQSFALLRLEGRVDSSLQAAVWDKLLRLPVPFFRDYTAGDLGSRAMAISQIRRLLSGSVMTTTLSGVFTFFNLALMFYYSVKLAAIGTAMVAFAFLITLFCSVFSLYYTRQEYEVQGKISGLILQLLSGIPKFRVAGAENRAFYVWTQEFTKQKQLSFRANVVESVIRVLDSVYPVLCTMVIFFALIHFNTANAAKGLAVLSTGKFLAFNSAFGSLLAAALSIAATVVSVLEVIPLYARGRPILHALPEVDEAKAAPRELAGGLEVNNLSFRYSPEAPDVLKSITFKVKPGEFIALVGPSGCGKSTLLRLLLGFEKPGSGGIFYDGQDVSSVDVTMLRQQLGVVLQAGRLMSGDIFENIVGSHNLGVDDAMEAAKMAGFDRDIEDMPMGLHTMVSEGGANLSGGQRQRLLIARALVRKPRIIYFDEATSALDNITQKIVSESLEKMNATRLVIAHRLSTIINADRIIVFADGHIVEQGSYDELMELDGTFAELARRQIA